MESPSAAALTGSSVKTKPAASVASQDASSLVNLLSKVDVSPADLLGALSKVQGQNQGSLEGENKDSHSNNFIRQITYLFYIMHHLKCVSVSLLSSPRHYFSSEQLNYKCLFRLFKYRQDSSLFCICSALSEPVCLLCCPCAFFIQLHCKADHKLPRSPSVCQPSLCSGASSPQRHGFDSRDRTLLVF